VSDERSQGQNRMRAMTLLRHASSGSGGRKVGQRTARHAKEAGRHRRRSEKIRTYNFPQDRITDHRINVSVFNMEKIFSREK